MDSELSRQASASDTPLEVLADLAYQHPELRVAIAANPATYPDLLQWLGSLGDPGVDMALRARVGMSDQHRAADPGTAPEALAELAYRHPELRATIAANPSAYDALREWIAQAGSTPAPVFEAPRVSGLTRLNAKFGPTFTLDSLVLVVIIAIISIASLVVGGVVVGTAGTAVSNLALGFSSPGNAVLDDITEDSLSGVGTSGEEQGVAGSGSAGSSGTGSSGTGQSGTGQSGTDQSGTDQSGTDQSGTDQSSSGYSQNATTPATKPTFVPTVLIFDASASMVRSIPSGGTRMAAARDAAITFVQGLSDNARMGLTVFGTGTGNADSDQAAGCFDVKRMIPVGIVDKDAFTSTIAGIVESGYTPLGPSMKDAAEQLAGYETAQIVLVTDGVDTCSPPPACEVAAALHSSRPGLTIHTIGFAVDSDELAQEQLSCIAAAGGGEAVDAGDAAQLAARLRAITDPVATAGAVNSSGFKGLKLGMSIGQVKSANSTLKLGEVILEIQYAECDDAVLQFKAGRLYSIQPKKPAPTAEGISPGDSLSTAIALYGAATQDTDSEGTYAQFPATKGSDSGYRIYFTPDSPGALSGKIIRIVLCLCGPGGGTVSEMTNWQIGFDGVGPIKLGMPFSEVFDIVPDPGAAAVIESTATCTATRLALSGVGRQIIVVNDSGGAGGKVTNILVSSVGGVAGSSLPKTSRGVVVGSTSEEVYSHYPEVTRVWSQAGSYQITTDAGGASLVFDTRANEPVVQVGSGMLDLFQPCR